MKRIIALIFVILVFASLASSAFAGKHVQQCWHDYNGTGAGHYYYCP